MMQADLKACIEFTAQFQREVARKHALPFDAILKEARDFHSKHGGVLDLFVESLERNVD